MNRKIRKTQYNTEENTCMMVYNNRKKKNSEECETTVEY